MRRPRPRRRAADNGRMTEDPRQQAAELAARKAWTLARLGELVNEGRVQGWLAGDPMEAVRDAEAARGRAHGLAGSTPMRVLAARLALTEVEMDVLWLLACIELEPALATVAQLLMSPGMHELNVQVLMRLSGSGGASVESLDRLQHHELIDARGDHRTPLYRRGVRASDRVIELARGVLALDQELAKAGRLAVADGLDIGDVDPPTVLARAVGAVPPVGGRHGGGRQRAPHRDPACAGSRISSSGSLGKMRR